MSQKDSSTSPKREAMIQRRIRMIPSRMSKACKKYWSSLFLAKPKMTKSFLPANSWWFVSFFGWQSSQEELFHSSFGKFSSQRIHWTLFFGVKTFSTTAAANTSIAMLSTTKCSSTAGSSLSILLPWQFSPREKESVSSFAQTTSCRMDRTWIPISMWSFTSWLLELLFSACCSGFTSWPIEVPKPWRERQMQHSTTDTSPCSRLLFIRCSSLRTSWTLGLMIFWSRLFKRDALLFPRSDQPLLK